MIPSQGEIWWAEAEDKRRPVLVVTRNEALPVLSRILVAPVTTTIRGITTELELDRSHGLPKPCVASFDNLQVIRRAWLTQRVGSLQSPELEVCQALAAVGSC